MYEVELGCLEIGLNNNVRRGTKEMNERLLKLPKFMRSFCWRLVEEQKVNPTKIHKWGLCHIANERVCCSRVDVRQNSYAHIDQKVTRLEKGHQNLLQLCESHKRDRRIFRRSRTAHGK